MSTDDTHSLALDTPSAGAPGDSASPAPVEASIAAETSTTTTTTTVPPTETDTSADRAAPSGAVEPERKRGRADGPLPPDAYGEVHGRPHTEKARKRKDVWGDMALQEMAARPAELGRAGRPIRLYANLFDVNLDEATKPIYHYDIDFIIPPKEDGGETRQKKMARTQAWELWQELGPSNPEIAHVFDAVAFDGLKNCFAPLKIPLKSNPNKDDTYSDHLSEGHLKCVYKEGKRVRDLWISFGLVGSKEDPILAQTLVRFCSATNSYDEEAIKASKKAPLVIQSLDILLRHDVHRRHPITSGQGRKFFAPGVNTRGIPKGGELMRGIFQSLRPTMSGPKLIVDAPWSAWVAGGRLDQVAAALVGKGGHNGGGGGRGGYGAGGRGGFGGGGGGSGGGDLDERDWRVVWKYLKKARVTLKHRDAGAFEIKSITREGASQRFFMLEHRVRRGDPEPDPPIPPQETSVANYYRDKLNIHLEKPNAPCVEIRGRQLIPVELCQLLPGQPIPFLLTSPEQTNATIQAAGKPPQQRKAEILQARTEASYHNESGPDGGAQRLAAWGVQVSAEMTKVGGRVLPAPRVMLGNGPANVRFGKFNLAGGARFIRPNRPLKSWAVLNFDNRVGDADIQDFVTILVQAGTAAGMRFDERYPRITRAGPDIRSSLKLAGKSAIVRSKEAFGEQIPPQLVLCIIPDRSAAESRSLYEAIKRIAIMDLPIPLMTQCMKGTKVRQTKPNATLQYCANLCTKINLKVHGSNWTVDTTAPPGTIIFGADIAHAAPGSNGASVASVVAATDGTMSDWKAEIRSQDAGVECLVGLDEMVLQHLQNFEATSGHAPKSLIFYRDGVSEGEFKQVVEVEVAGVKAACEIFSPGQAIPVTYIICGKRGKTRFFASEADASMADRNGNLPAGTVVDAKVTSPLVWDFFLQAHSGLLGTAKPTHYHVLCDENNFTQDGMQTLTNSLCWLFGRATMGVSLVAPAYLADVACEKARLLIAPDFDDASTATGSSNEQPALFLDPLRIRNQLNRGQGVSNGWFM